MISFRYHLVTIVAVFLALGLGLLAGTTIVQPRLVDELKAQSERQLQTIDDLRGQVTDVRSLVADLESFANAVSPYLTQDRLALADVVIVAQEGVDGAVLNEARTALASAGATVLAELSVRPKMASSNPADQEQLAAALGIPDPVPDQLPTEAAASLARRLATAPAALADGSIGPDVLRDLLEQGFLVSTGERISDATLKDIGGRGQVVVVLGGGDAEPFLAPEAFMVPLVDELVGSGVDVAAGESTTSAYPFVELLRSDAAVGDGNEMITVDDLEMTMGGVALVLGLQQLIATNDGGNYGVKGGVDPIPALT